MKTDLERLQTRREREQRKEVIRLKARVRELEKKLRIYEMAALDADVESEPWEEVQVAEEGKEQYLCPECKEPTFTFELAGRPYYRCAHCMAKGKITA